MKSAEVNIWQLITTLSGRELPYSKECKEFEEMAIQGFGNEASLEVNEHGTWTFRFFSCYDNDNQICLKVTKRGDVSVTRKTTTNVTEERTVSF